MALLKWYIVRMRKMTVNISIDILFLSVKCRLKYRWKISIDILLHSVNCRWKFPSTFAFTQFKSSRVKVHFYQNDLFRAKIIDLSVFFFFNPSEIIAKFRLS